MGDQLLSFFEAGLGLLTQVADERHRVGRIPVAARRQAPQTVGRTLGPSTEDDRIRGDFDIESIAGRDVERTARFARDDDLVLCTDLDA
jgi:hypothetical protein